MTAGERQVGKQIFSIASYKRKKQILPPGNRTPFLSPLTFLTSSPSSVSKWDVCAGQSTSHLPYLTVHVSFHLNLFSFYFGLSASLGARMMGSFDSSSSVRSRSSLDLLKCLHQHRFSISWQSKKKGDPPHSSRKKENETRRWCVCVCVGLQCSVFGTTQKFKRNIQEKALELTADFMVNWIRFETSVYTIHPGLFLCSYTHTFHQCVPNSLSTSLSLFFSSSSFRKCILMKTRF